MNPTSLVLDTGVLYAAFDVMFSITTWLRLDLPVWLVLALV
jgi:hypothetical protein